MAIDSPPITELAAVPNPTHFYLNALRATLERHRIFVGGSSLDVTTGSSITQPGANMRKVNVSVVLGATGVIHNDSAAKEGSAIRAALRKNDHRLCMIDCTERFPDRAAPGHSFSSGIAWNLKGGYFIRLSAAAR